MTLFPDPALNLAIALAKYPLSADEIKALHPLRDAVTDWERFLFWGNRHGIVGVALANGRALLPADVYAKLKQIQYLKSVRAMQLQALLADLGRRFQAEGIEFFVIKGVALSQQLYQSISFRSAGDLDIVVSIEDVPRAEKILLAMACRRLLPARALTSKQWRFYARYKYHFLFNEPTNNLAIEIHWALAQPYIISVATSRRWLQRGKTVRLAEISAQTLSLEDNFAYLLLHSARHYWESAKYFSDLLALIQRPEMNWEQVRATIQENHLEQVMSANFILLQTIYGQPIPAALESLVARNRKVDFLVETGLQALTLPVGALSAFRSAVCELMFKPDWNYKLYSLSSVLFAWIWKIYVLFKGAKN